ncbi:methyl-accepting chemotaxis protein [Shewanella gelidii]|uniref:Methyl-accepting chemotaxis protein n=1 Tax=Shewanella gelidii TaxID=1642821 RepID=A0A917JUL6_9GAMM|nr:methyl-accepting chemotaxis protein [Shewanella gelidii]MCL1098502.1 methyl-accepting chemotaxis protein [Shewanella gelidii]GGI82246.1 methyl-accepting chemotaxis protein [Shewanella gelidii]
MKPFSALSIKNRLVLAMLLAVVVSTSVVALVGHTKSKELLVDRLQQSDLPNLVQRVRNAVNGEISEMQVLTQSIATNPYILNWVNNGFPADEEATLVDFLGRVAKANGLSNASFADKQSNKYWNQDGFLRELQNDNADGWFFAFKNSGNAESASTYTYPNGNVDVFVNFQQLNGQGVSGVSKSFNEMVRYLSGFKIEETGFVYLVDGSGLVKIHKDKSISEKQNISALYEGVNTSALLGKQEFAFGATDDQIIATSFIPNLGWYVVAEVPKQELYIGLNNAENYMLMTFLIVTIIFVVISLILANNLVRPLNHMAEAFEELGKGEGDLTSRIDESGAEEISRLAKGFNVFVAKIQTVVQDVATTAKDVTAASENVYQDAENSRVMSDRQRDEAHQVSVAINEMGSTIAEIANNAGVAAQTTNEANEMALNAQGVVRESNTTINQMAENMESVSTNIEVLAEKSISISSVLDVIRGISEQTNLLALNAAIEAARAGEQGRGFAVVADEVRGLAKRTSDSTDEIHAMITELQDGAKTAVASVQQGREHAELGVQAAVKTNQALEEIVGNVQHISDLNTQVATATEEQSAVIGEINIHVVNISDSTDKSAEGASSIAKSSDSLKSMAQTLDELVNRFKL